MLWHSNYFNMDLFGIDEKVNNVELKEKESSAWRLFVNNIVKSTYETDILNIVIICTQLFY